jgi:CBS domain-containing protein
MPIDDSLLNKFTIGPDASIEEALRRIEFNTYGTLIVLGSRGQVVGTLTDGDIRKSFLDHRLIVIPVRDVMNTDFLSVPVGEYRKAKELFQARFYLRLIPMVQPDGTLHEILFRDQLS